jgi:transglutaminase-like putative cysteine protease
MLRRCMVIAFSLLGFILAGRGGAAADWYAISDEEMRLTASDIGDPEADAAILFREGHLDDTSADGTTLRVYMRIKIFNERGRRYRDVQLPYRVELGRITDVSARTIRADRSVVEVTSRDIFDRVTLKTRHGVWRAKVFSMPAVEPGVIIEYRYRQVYPAGFRYFQLDLQSELFTRKLHYEIQPLFAPRLDVRWVSFNTKDPKRFAPTWDGAFEIRAETIAPFRHEPLMPPELGVKMWGWLYYSGEFETDPEKYWRAYAGRMHDRAKNETRPTPLIRRVVGAITLAADDANQKIARLYDYLQKEIHNIGEAKAGEENEAEADLKKNERVDDTLRRRYGTPRDINRLFIAMLRAAGLDARVAELTTRDENFFHRSFPDAFQFNSEVAAVIRRDGALQFFDVGTPFCPRGLLSWEKEGVTALVYGNRDWRFVEIPVSDATASATERRVNATVNGDGQVDARVEMKLTGQRALAFRNETVDATQDEQRKRIAADVRSAMPAATVDETSFVVANPRTATAPVAAAYRFNAPQFATRTEKRLLVRPAMLSRRDEWLLTAPRRTNNVYFDFPWSESERVVIEAPDGYLPEALPGAIEIDIGAARYRASFTGDGRRVIYERRLIVNAINFTAEQYGTVREFFNRVLEADRTAISFKQ